MAGRAKTEPENPGSSTASVRVPKGKLGNKFGQVH